MLLQGDSGGPVMKLSGPPLLAHDPSQGRKKRYHLVGVSSAAVVAYNMFMFEDDNGCPTDQFDKLPRIHHACGGKI